jgi:hypothetical protein
VLSTTVWVGNVNSEDIDMLREQIHSLPGVKSVQVPTSTHTHTHTHSLSLSLSLYIVRFFLCLSLLLFAMSEPVRQISIKFILSIG